jgi:hypothetical protein
MFRRAPPVYQEPYLNARRRFRCALARTRRWVSGHHGVRLHHSNLFLGGHVFPLCFLAVAPGAAPVASRGSAPTSPPAITNPVSPTEDGFLIAVGPNDLPTTSGTVAITTLVAEKPAVLCPNAQTRKSHSYQHATPQQREMSRIQNCMRPSISTLSILENGQKRG